ncbi:MAG: peptidylprolyl isomerase [Clostridiales bacterium]|nr:peptidylprolyl isomerase [Clostridiales bacterium]
MAKKELNEDLLAGGSLSSSDDKSDKKADKAAKKSEKAAKKAEKKSAKAAKVRQKLAEKRAAIKKQIDVLKELKADETDEKKLADLDKKIKKLSDKYSAVGASNNNKGLAPRTAKIIKSVVCIVVVVALLFTYVATGTVRKGFIASLSLPAQTLTGVTVTNGEQKAKIKVSTYNYYFAMMYNNLQSTQETYESYGLDLETYNLDVDFDKSLSKQTTTNDDGEEVTWAEYLEEEVIESIKSTYTYYLEAVAANDGEDPEITEDQQSELDETLDEYRETAHEYGYTLSGYLVAAMGKGVTESVFRQEATRAYIAENYEEELSDELASVEYTDEDYEQYLEENEEDLTTVDIRLFECSSEDDAKAFADSLKSDGSNFSDLCVEYASTDFEQKAYADDGYSTELGATKTFLQNNGYAIATAEETDDEDEDAEESYPGLDWLFSSDRKAGDIKQYSTTVVYVLDPASVTDRKTVNVRHILISPITDEDDDTDPTEATDEQWTTAYETAKDILAEFKDGDQTEDSFAELATENSTDTGSSEDGGLYENVVTSEMVNSFNTWCFEDGREAGDTAIIRSDYGYHVMYFVGENDMTVWEYTAQQALASEDSTTTIEELEESYEAKVSWFGSRYFEKDVDIDT